MYKTKEINDSMSNGNSTWIYFHLLILTVEMPRMRVPAWYKHLSSFQKRCSTSQKMQHDHIDFSVIIECLLLHSICRKMWYGHAFHWNSGIILLAAFILNPIRVSRILIQLRRVWRMAWQAEHWCMSSSKVCGLPKVKNSCTYSNSIATFGLPFVRFNYADINSVRLLSPFQGYTYRFRCVDRCT